MRFVFIITDMELEFDEPFNEQLCDNCGKCIDFQDVASIKIDKIYTNPDEYKD